MNPLLVLAIGAVAMLYASVGHAGATGYIAVMALFGIVPDVIRPTSLVLNVIVASIATLQFWRAGHFRSSIFMPLAAASVPAAVLGGAMHLSIGAFESIVGVVLVVSAIRIIVETSLAPSNTIDADLGASRPLTTAFLATLGGALGLLAGLTGVGGGVFLTPALLALRAAPVKQVAAVSAPFILVNSLAGLGGRMVAGGGIPPISLPVIVAAVVGGTIGSSGGAFLVSSRTVRLLMAVVLVIAGLKLLA